MFPQQMFPVRVNGETFRETTMFPQQCFLVCGGLKGHHCPGDMAVRMRKVLQTAGLVFECVPCNFRFFSLIFIVHCDIRFKIIEFG